MEDAAALEEFLDGFTAVEGAKVLVHGGGREATRIAARLGIETRMAEGRRITDAPMLEVVTMVYAGKVNKAIVAGLQKRGCKAIGLSGADMNSMISRKRPVGEIDYGYVGDIQSVDAEAIAMLIDAGIIPVMVPITSDGCGQLLNTNADSVASAVARALAAKYEVTLVSCFEKKGVLSDPDDDDSVISSINKESYARLKADGTVSGGMLPKLQNAFEALEAGVSKVLVTKADQLGNENAGTTITI